MTASPLNPSRAALNSGLTPSKPDLHSINDIDCSVIGVPESVFHVETPSTSVFGFVMSFE
jgi:hypothetical protein